MAIEINRTPKDLILDPITVLEALPNPLFTIDYKNEISYLNPSAELFFDGSSMALQGVALSELLPVDMPLFDMISQARSNGTSISDYDLLIETPRIGIKVVNIGISPISDSDGSVIISLFERSIAQKLHQPKSSRQFC